jgi:hypothetical protein
MTRTLLQLTVVALVCGLVGAQSTVTVGDRLNMLKRNRTLISDLVRHGVHLSQKNSDLDRADETLQSASRLRLAYNEAISNGDVPRLLEVSDLLGGLIEKGFVPSYTEAQRLIKPGSPDYDRFLALQAETERMLSDLVSTIPTTGEQWSHPDVQATRSKLEAQLKLIPTPALR